MLLESAAVLVSWDGGVFFDLDGAFATGFTVLGEKMSSLKNREIKLVKYSKFKRGGGVVVDHRADSIKSVK